RIYNRVLSANEIQTLFAEGDIEQSYAVRSFGNSFASNSLPVDVTLDIQNPIEGVLVETLPAGWSATHISNGGTLDGSTISWNLTPSTTSVSYTATPTKDTSAARFSGKLDGLYTAGEVMITVIQGQVGEFDFHADIGNVGAEGSSTYNEGADEYSIIGSGANIGGSEDAFHFAFSELEGPFRLAGNAFLDPLESTHDNIKAGLMVRNNLSTGSSYGFLQIRTDFQMRWQQRLAQGNASQQGSLLDDQFGDMILERNGQTISYYYINLDGQETFMGSSTLEDLDDPVYAGLAVTSHEQGNLSNLLFTQLNIELIDFDAKRHIQLDESGFAKFGETLTVQINVYNRNDSQVSVIETVPAGWEVGTITPSAGQATINATGQVEWSIDSLLGDATLSYEITTPTDAETAEIVGQFSGEANGNAIGGDSSAIVRGLLPEDVLNQQDIKTGLVAQWTLDEGTGTTVADSSGRGHDGSFLMGEPAWVEGIRGTALEFDGDDAVEIGWLGIGGADPRTITAWVKTDAGNPDAYIGWGSASAGNGAKWHLLIRGNGLLRTAIAGTNINGSTILNDGQWHFIAVVLPNGKTLVQDIVHYVDGVEDVVSAIATMDVPVNTSTDEGAGAFNIRLGSRDQNGDRFFEGIIDEVRIYDRGLSTKEVQAVMVSEGGYPTAVDDFMLY
ncbi:hypothetical protein GF373_13685, partial [bacterium]|nr:hypothetical protein [bacterium]